MHWGLLTITWIGPINTGSQRVPDVKIPNLLTLFRIACIPIVVIVYYLPFHAAGYYSAGVFVIASITDLLDGYLARTLNQTTALGAFLDPVADKLLVAVCLVLLVAEPNLPFLAIPAAIIISREIVISALREWMAELGKRTSVAVSFLGKIKTCCQMFSIVILLAFRDGQQLGWLWLGYLSLYLAAGLTLWSMIIYLKAAWSDLKNAN